MKTPVKTILILPDGMADEPIAELGGKTPLQAARTPAMDEIARRGASGTLRTLPEGFPTSSDVANMSVMGCDLRTEYCGRGVLEAVSKGVPLAKTDVAFRFNTCSVAADGTLADFSGGHPAEADVAVLVETLNRELGSDKVSFHQGVSYRNILVLHGAEFSADIHCQKPDDNSGNPYDEHVFPDPNPGFEKDERALHTCAFVADLIRRARTVLAGGRINAIWPWSAGQAGAIRDLRTLRGITGAVVSAVDVINGLGRAVGMDVVKVPGATGYIDTNYEGKAAAALEAIRTHDFVYVHVEATDEVSHAQDLALKLRVIEDVDSRLVAPILQGAGPDVRLVVLPDHPVPIALGKHTRIPVPVAVCGPGIEPDGVQAYGETEALAGSLGAFHDSGLMDFLFPPIG